MVMPNCTARSISGLKASVQYKPLDYLVPTFTVTIAGYFRYYIRFHMNIY